MAQMLLGAVNKRTLAHLRRRVLAVDGCHIVLLARASHERSRFASVFMFLGPWLAVNGRVKVERERARIEIVYRHSPRDVYHSRFEIIREGTAVVNDHQWRHVGDAIRYPASARCGGLRSTPCFP